MIKEKDIVLLDLELPDSRGLDTLRIVLMKAGHLPVVVLTGLQDEETGLAAIERGAQDYLVKGEITAPLLSRAIRQAIERKRIEEELRLLRNLLGNIIDSMPSVLIGLDCDGRVAHWNRLAEEKTGKRAEEVRGRRICDIFPGLPLEVEMIGASGQRVSRIIGNMLDYSRKGPHTFAHHDLDTLIDRSIELARHDYAPDKRYDFRDIEIVRDYGVLPPVPCEFGEIQQVFLNLLSNGAHAMLNWEGMNREPRFTLRIRPDGEEVRIEVADNGPGMTEEVVEQVFDPFFTTKEAGLGAGLGLSVAFFIITERHGGRIEVRSRAGKGARFIIHLPLKRGDGLNVPVGVA